MKDKKEKAQNVQGTDTPEIQVIDITNHKPSIFKPAYNLEQTVQLVEDLHRKKVHRDRLNIYVDQLTKFEFKRDTEELDDKSYYTGCKMTIKDDDNREFTLKHPVIIKEVVDFVKTRFAVKLAEIEAEIVLPY